MYISTKTVLALALVGGQAAATLGAAQPPSAAAAIAARSAAGQPGANLEAGAPVRKPGDKSIRPPGAHVQDRKPKPPRRSGKPPSDCRTTPGMVCLIQRSVAVEAAEEVVADESTAAALAARSATGQPGANLEARSPAKLIDRPAAHLSLDRDPKPKPTRPVLKPGDKHIRPPGWQVRDPEPKTKPPVPGYEECRNNPDPSCTVKRSVAVEAAEEVADESAAAALAARSAAGQPGVNLESTRPISRSAAHDEA
ncbi:hypothetical protein MAPG_08774, partial [Magnaporthiopsis poae ATCC 64411]